MAIVNKTGFEVYTEVENIVANLEGYIDALCLLDNVFSLDHRELDEIERFYLVANYTTIGSIHTLVETGLREIVEKIEAINTEKEDSDPEPTESAN